MKLSYKALFITLLLPLNTYAWNALGHMVIADIAYQQLTPVAKQNVDELNAVIKTEYPKLNSFDQMAAWPDALRSQQIETFTHWHYIDKTLNFDGKQYADQIDTDNAVWALEKIKVIVENERANPLERARFLAFFVHIVGDLHQPLHTVSFFSEAHPLGDRGGNDYFVKYHHKKIRLHALWDSGVGVLEGQYSVARAHAIATAVLAEHPIVSNNTDSESWVTEGMSNAKKYVYSVDENTEVNGEYIKKADSFVEADLALAGYRLSVLLNEMLG